MDVRGIAEQLKKDEGYSKVSFWDDAAGGGKGQWTYGYGCEAPGEGAEITREEAVEKLAARVEVAIREFEIVFFGVPIDDVRAEALVNMIYNLGGPRFRGFKRLIAAVKLSDWGHAAYEAFDSLWFRQLSKRGLSSIERSERIVWELLTGIRG